MVPKIGIPLFLMTGSCWGSDSRGGLPRARGRTHFGPKCLPGPPWGRAPTPSDGGRGRTHFGRPPGGRTACVRSSPFELWTRGGAKIKRRKTQSPLKPIKIAPCGLQTKSVVLIFDEDSENRGPKAQILHSGRFLRKRLKTSLFAIKMQNP